MRLCTWFQGVCKLRLLEHVHLLEVRMDTVIQFYNSFHINVFWAIKVAIDQKYNIKKLHTSIHPIFV